MCGLILDAVDGIVHSTRHETQVVDELLAQFRQGNASLFAEGFLQLALDQ